MAAANGFIIFLVLSVKETLEHNYGRQSPLRAVRALAPVQHDEIDHHHGYTAKPQESESSGTLVVEITKRRKYVSWAADKVTARLLGNDVAEDTTCITVSTHSCKASVESDHTAPGL